MATTPEDLGKQFQIQQDINKVLQERSGLYKGHTSELRTQLGLAKQLLKVLDKTKPPGADSIREMNDALEDATDSAERLGDELEDAGEKGADAADKANSSSGGLIKNLSVGKTMAVGFGVGLFSAFKGAAKMLGNVASGVMGVVTTLGKLAFAIISTPFKILGGLIAQAGGMGQSEIRVALEEIRDQFGSLASNEGQMLAQTLQDVRSQSQDLAGTGLRMGRIYGYGRDGVAQAMRDFMEIAAALGPGLNSMTDAIRGNQVQLDMQRKGLGLTAEAFADVMRAAKDMGKDPVAAMTEFSGVALSMGKHFGINVKTMSKGMAEITKDVENFGNMGAEEMGKVTVYATKLGVEISTLGKMSEKWLNFDDAAESASMLQQAFGMNIDAMQMMQEQNPAKQAQAMKDAFDATGRSVADMTKQELKLLSTTMNLSAEEARRFLSGEANYDEIGKSAETEMSVMKEQSKIMKEMADNIKKLTKQGTKQFTSFFDAIKQGFSSGFQRTEEYRGLMISINQSLRHAYKFGRKLGRLFMKEFPGVQKMFKGLKQIFDPASFSKLFGDFYKAFADLFKALRTDPKAGVEKFVESIKEAFRKFFGRSGSGVAMVKDGAGEFLKAFGALFRELFILAVKGLTSMVGAINDWLEEPYPPAGADKLADAFRNLWAEIVKTLELVMPDLLRALGKMVTIAFKTFINSPMGQKAVDYFMYFIGTKIILGATMSALKGGAAAKALKLLAGFFTKTAVVSSVVPTPPVHGTGVGWGIFTSELSILNPASIAKALGVAVVLASFLVIGMAALAVGFLVAYELLKGVDPAGATKTAAIMVAMALVVAALGFVVLALQNPGAQMASPKDLLPLAMLALIAGALGLFSVIIMGIMGMITKMPTTEGIIKFFLFQVILVLTMAGLALVLLMIYPIANEGTVYPILVALLILGLLAIGLGFLTVQLMEYIGGLNIDADHVGKIVSSMIDIIWTCIALIPTLLVLGVMMLPFMGAGLALMVLGFKALSILAMSLVESVEPAILRIAAMEVPDPDTTRKVVDMIIDVINSIANFVGELAGLISALKPPPGAEPDQLEKNIAACTSLVEALVGDETKGIGRIIDLLINLAKSPDITDQGLSAMNALSGVLTAIGGIVGVLQPNKDMMKSVADNIDDDDLDEFMHEMGNFADKSGKRVTEVIQKIADVFLNPTFLAAANGVNEQGLAFIGALAPVFESLGGIATALQPNPEIFKAVMGGIDDDDYDEFVEELTEMTKSIGPQIARILKEFGPMINTVMVQVESMLTNPAMQGVGAEKIKAIAGLIAPIAEAFSGLATGIGPVIQSTIEGASRMAMYDPLLRGAQGTVDLVAAVTETIGDMFGKLVPAIESLVLKMFDLAKTVTCPEEAEAKISAVAGALGVLKIIQDIFNPQDPGNPFSTLVGGEGDKFTAYVDKAGNKRSNMQATVIMINNIIDDLLYRGGPVHRLIQSMANMPAISADQMKNICSAKVGLEVLASVMTLMDSFKKMGASASGDNQSFDPTTARINADRALRAMNGINWHKDDDSLFALLTKLSDDRLYKIPKRRLKEVGEVIKSATEGPLAAIADLVIRSKEVKDLIRGMGDINLRSDIHSLANAIGIDKETFTIDNDPVQITINLDLKMDADQIATRLSRTTEYQTVKVSG